MMFYTSTIIGDRSRSSHKVWRSNFEEGVPCSCFAREDLPLPVPHVLHYPGSARRRIIWNISTFNMNNKLRGVWYISTEEISGVSLDKAIDTLSEEQPGHVGLQLREYVKKIRSVRGRTLRSITGQPHRTFPVSPFYQPRETFENFADFREYLFALLFACKCLTPKHIDELFCAFFRNASMRFAHADPAPKNTMADGSTITGIIDGVLAGFYPDFWEYCCMHEPLFMTPAWDKECFSW
ncbi:unnamed protein product [Somion occarium]